VVVFETTASKYNTEAEKYLTNKKPRKHNAEAEL
jgi:hypothetical protein